MPKKNYPKSFYLKSFLMAALFLLSNCGGGSSEEASATKNIIVKVSGVRSSAGDGDQLRVKVLGKTETIKTNGTYNFTVNANNGIEIVTHPEGQACILDKGSEVGSFLLMCGLRNEIRVSGIDEILASNNPLIITRDLIYYENQSIPVSQFALMSIFKSSTAFITDKSGKPKDESYYSFLYSVASEDFKSFIQEIRIVRTPTGYECHSFEGEKGFHQIICNKTGASEVKYELAQKCVALYAPETEGYVTLTGEGLYQIENVDLSMAEPFFIKPARLGSFLLYDTGKNFFSSDAGDQVVRLATANAYAEWSIVKSSIVVFQDGVPLVQEREALIRYDSNRQLNQDLTLKSKSPSGIHHDSTYIPEADTFELVELTDDNCTTFPEADLNAVISPEFYTPRDPALPIYGFADVHAHFGFPKAMGAMAMSGNIVHAYGIEHALKDCDSLHGSSGSEDLLENQNGSGGGHDVNGYPEFNYWPNKDTVTHVTAYHRWIERAYLSGLRVAVTLVTGNPTFCEVLEQLHPGKKQAGCKGTAAVKAQTDYLYQIQDYIDAQAGGPGKGWFRIVTSAQQARQVISENKLAVVLGTEHGELFNCRERSTCSNSYIDTQLDALYNMGVRSVFPVHRFDNAFAGTMVAGGSRNAWMNLTSKISTSEIDELLDVADPLKYLISPIGGHYWQLEACTDGIQGTNGMYSMVDFKNNELTIITDPLPVVLGVDLGDVVEDKLEPFPDYTDFQGNGNACNVRGLHTPGQYLIQRLIDKGMIIELDHLSHYAARAAMDIIEANNYSGFISSHGWIEGSTETRNRIINQGGMVGIFNGSPSSFANTLDFYRDTATSEDYLISFALGSDIQGVTSQPSSDAGVSITYPFTSLDGMVTFLQPQTGSRSFDYASEGVAHYGLYPEWLENLRQVDATRGDDVLDVFMNSAEAYVQMWERAEAHAAANQ